MIELLLAALMGGLMAANSEKKKCSLCGGTGIIYSQIGPSRDCYWCNGTGRR